MKREERKIYNSLKKTVTPDTLYVEIPTNWTHEARQAIHELLTVEKGMIATVIGPDCCTFKETIRYTHSSEATKAIRQTQEVTDIDEVMKELRHTDYTWNGHKINEEEPDTNTAEPAQTESKEEEKKMLRSNSKQARENIRAYIVDHFDGTNYAPDFDYIEQAQKDTAQGIRNVDIFSMVAHAIAATFYNEKCRFYNRFKAGRLSRYELFEDWCAGLPSILDTCYYYNRSAVDDLGNILQENDAEKAKYTEQQAEKRLTQLIYREIYSVKGVS